LTLAKPVTVIGATGQAGTPLVLDLLAHGRRGLRGHRAEFLPAAG
jgi:hypothetical protein